MERNEESDRALENPLADAIAGRLLDASDQGGVVNDAVEDLARWWLGRAQRRSVGLGPEGWVDAAHRGRRELLYLCVVVTSAEIYEVGLL